jgi:hypothetical protein
MKREEKALNEGIISARQPAWANQTSALAFMFVPALNVDFLG